MEQHYQTMSAGGVAGAFTVILSILLANWYPDFKVTNEGWAALQIILTVPIAYYFRWQSQTLGDALNQLTQAVTTNGRASARRDATVDDIKRTVDATAKEAAQK